jgi:hypothetical protein
MRTPWRLAATAVADPEALRVTGRQRGLTLALVLVAGATFAVFPVESVQLRGQPSFVPAMLALVGCFDLLSALFLLRQFLDTGDRVALRLSWAYVFSLVVLAGYGASFPGVLGAKPPPCSEPLDCSMALGDMAHGISRAPGRSSCAGALASPGERIL